MSEQEPERIFRREVEAEGTWTPLPETGGAETLPAADVLTALRRRERASRTALDQARFTEYARTRSTQLRNELILENERIVHFLLGRFAAPPG